MSKPRVKINLPTAFRGEDEVRPETVMNSIKSVFDKVDIDAFFKQEVYGNLRMVKGKILQRKRARLHEMGAKVCRAVKSILDTIPPAERKGAGYEGTLELSLEMFDCKHVLNDHPHVWPLSHMYEYLLDLRMLITAVNNGTGGSIESDSVERFVVWEDPEKILLPFPNSKLPLKFLGAPLCDIFPFVLELHKILPDMLYELSTPSYAWQIAVSTNIKRFIRLHGAGFEAVEGAFKEYAKSNIVKHYLARINATEYTMAAGEFLAGLGGMADASTSKSLLSSLVGRNRDVIAKIFGSATLAEFEKINEHISSGELVLEDPPA